MRPESEGCTSHKGIVGRLIPENFKKNGSPVYGLFSYRLILRITIIEYLTCYSGPSL